MSQPFEDILKQREEEKKEQYSSIETGYYIQHEVVKFQQETILNTINVYVPQSFQIMPFALAQIKYPSAYRPAFLLTKSDLSVDLGFSILEQELQGNGAESLINQIREGLIRENHIKCSEAKPLIHVNGWYLSFRSHTMDTDLYLMQMIMPLKEQLLQATANFPYSQYQEWEPAILSMWETIEEALPKEKQ